MPGAENVLAGGLDCLYFRFGILIVTHDAGNVSISGSNTVSRVID
jgi:hypothetical protein